MRAAVGAVVPLCAGAVGRAAVRSRCHWWAAFGFAHSLSRFSRPRAGESPRPIGGPAGPHPEARASRGPLGGSPGAQIGPPVRFFWPG